MPTLGPRRLWISGSVGGPLSEVHCHLYSCVPEYVTSHFGFLCAPDGMYTFPGRKELSSHLKLDAVPLSHRSAALNGTGSKEMLNFPHSKQAVASKCAAAGGRIYS